ncbi:MAG: DUF3823 domain-containing protein [Muribaculaceae bacterium]
MKKNLLYFMAAMGLVLGSCEADNMKAPYCHITGKMCYEGNAIGVRGSGSNQLTPTVEIEVWEAGFGKEAALNVNVKQDGTFSTYVYPGEKRIITKKGVGPWQQADTLRIKVDGDVNVDYEVKPYFTISNVNYSFNDTDSTLTATFHIEQVDDEAELKSVGLLVNNTQFVDMVNYKVSKTSGATPGEVSLTVELAGLKAKYPAMYARVFVKSDKSSYECYSTTPYHVW